MQKQTLSNNYILKEINILLITKYHIINKLSNILIIFQTSTMNLLIIN
jgi:hypothetical protein